MKDKDTESELDPREIIESLDKEKSDEIPEKPDNDGEKEEAVAEKGPSPSLVEAIKGQAREDEQPQSKTFTLRKILGGDLLSAALIRKQIWVVVIIATFIVLYITNRYSCQRYLIQIDKLNKELKDVKYRAMSSGSMLTEMSRESRVLEKLKENEDSVLHISKQPPFIIKVPKE